MEGITKEEIGIIESTEAMGTIIEEDHIGDITEDIDHIKEQEATGGDIAIDVEDTGYTEENGIGVDITESGEDIEGSTIGEEGITAEEGDIIEDAGLIEGTGDGDNFFFFLFHPLLIISYPYLAQNYCRIP